MKECIVSILRESADLKLRFAKESAEDVVAAATILQKALKSGNKLLIFGNGGSASDSQHIAAELVNKYALKRKALPAIALTTDGSILTPISNDGSFENVFSRQIEALGKKGDVALGLSTGGKSPNVIKALKTAKSMELKTIAFVGSDKSKVRRLADCCISVPSKSTPRIQELHITIAHIMCELIEDALSDKKESSSKNENSQK
jgi:D-sedoheptulose 7-phosphate isomerase